MTNTKTKTLIFSAIVFFGVLFFAKSSFAATWYVDNTATGSNNGTSWTNAFTSLTTNNSVHSGDTVYISGGTLGVGQTYDMSAFADNGWIGRDGVTYETGTDVGHNGYITFDGHGYKFFIRGGTNATFDFTAGCPGACTQGASAINYTNAMIYADSVVGLKVKGISCTRGTRMDSGATGYELAYLRIVPEAGKALDTMMDFSGPHRDSTFASSGTIHHNHLYPRRCPPGSKIMSGDDAIQNASNTDIHDNHIEGIPDANYGTNGTYPSGICNAVDGQHQDGYQGTGDYMRFWNNSFVNLSNAGIFMELFPNIGSCTRSNVYIWNNLFYSTGAGLSGVPIHTWSHINANCNPLYVQNFMYWNNTFVDIPSEIGVRINSNYSATNCPIFSDFYAYNNLFANVGDINKSPIESCEVPPSACAITTVNSYNKALAWSEGGTNICPANVHAPDGDTNLRFVSYTEYSPSNDFHLASNDTGARGAGKDFSSILPSGVTVCSIPGTDPCGLYDKDGVPRPSGSAWDIGAYEYVGSGMPPPDTTPPNAPMGVQIQ